MKKAFTLLLFSVFICCTYNAHSQACSPQIACTPLGTGPISGGFEDPDTTPCAIQGVLYSHAIQFNMYNAFDFLGHQTVDSIEFVSIDNLPCGLCWSLDQADKRYSADEAGCLNISGTSNDVAGQYKFTLVLKAWINGTPTSQTIPSSLVDQTGIRIFLRVKSSGGTCTPVDTSASANNLTASTGPCTASAVSVTLGSDVTVCHDSMATLSSSVAGGTPSYTYAWTATGDALSCTTCANPTVTVTQNSVYSVVVTDAGSNTATDTINVLVNNCAPLDTCNAFFVVYADSLNAGLYYGYNQSTGSNLTYMWYFGDGDSSSQQYPSHSYVSPGRYFVCLTANGTNGCTTTYCDSSFYVFKTEAGLMTQLTILSPTGIKDVEKESRIVLYPNPASTQLFIQTNGVHVEQINIYNTTGSLVMTAGSSIVNSQLSIVNLPNGVYVAEIKTKDASVKRRWVKM